MDTFSDKKINRRDFLKLTAVSLAAGGAVLAGCGTPATQAPAGFTAVPTTKQSLKTMRFAVSQAIGPDDTADPVTGTNFGDAVRLGLCYDQLVSLNDKLVPEPRLAESWASNDKGDEWTFKLRQGVTFHNGNKFTAKDVVYTYKRIMDPATASPGASALSGLDPEGIEALDDYTVRFKLPNPVVDLYYLLTNRFTYIVPEGATKEDLKLTPMGTGAFKLGEFVPGEQPQVFLKNASYWESGLPKVDRFELRSFPEPAARLAALLAKQVDIIEDPLYAQIEQLKGNQEIEVVGIRTGAWDGLIMRCDTPPFDNNDLRLALKYCIDRKMAIDLVLSGYGDVANDVPVPSWIQYGLPDAPRERNIQKAKEHLANAGYPNGIDLDLYWSTTGTNWQSLVSVFKENCAEAGVKINLIQAATDTWWSETWLKKPFCMTMWSAYTPDSILSVAYMSNAEWNETFWKRPSFDELIAKARSTKDVSDRTKLYQQAQQMIIDDGGSIIPYFLNNLAGKASTVSGWLPSWNRNFYDFRTVDIAA